MMKKVFVLLFPLVMLTGCVTGGMPQTVEEFRIAITNSSSMFIKTETVEINRPFSKVYADVKKYGEKCMNYKETVTSRSRTSYQKITTYYSALAEKTGKGKGQIAMQLYHAEGVLKVYEEPEGGYFYFLADMTSKGRNNTLLEMHGGSFGKKDLYKAMESWANGKKYKNCPPK
jgi:hypothetical protein